MRNVVVSAGLMSSLQVLGLLLVLSTGRNLGTAFMNFVLGMVLPFCGYVGATRSLSQLMCCFSFTSLVTAICQFILVTNVLLMIWFISMNEEAT